MCTFTADQSLRYESGKERSRIGLDGDVLVYDVIEWIEEKKKHIVELIKERAFDDERSCGKEKQVLKIALSLIMYSVAWLELKIMRKSPDPDEYRIA